MKPRDQQIKLLKESLKKWEKIVAGEALDHGCDDCPLCQEYNINKGGCIGCPLEEQGEEFFCFNSDGIYSEFVNYCSAWRRANDELPMYCDESNAMLMKDGGYIAKADEMENMLHYMISLYELKKIHDKGGIKPC